MTDVLVTLDRFEDSQGVLLLPDGQELSVERSALPAEAHEGSQLYLALALSPETEAAKRAQARELLSAILRGK